MIEENLNHGSGECEGIPPLANSLEMVRKFGKKQRIVIVGLGMVGLAFLEKMLKEDTAQEYTYLILGEEPHYAYNRVGLTEFFEHREFEKLLLAPQSFYEGRNVGHWDYRIGESVVKVCKEEQFVQTSSGNKYEYDHLVLSTGSTALLPLDMLPTPKNMDPLSPQSYGKMGCFVYRTIDDLNSMLAFSEKLMESVTKPTTKRAVVVGGGLLGLEAAKALLDMEIYDNVTVVHRSKWLLSQQLDEKGGKLLTDKVTELKVTARTGTLVDKVVFDKNGKLSSIQYNNDEEDECQLLCYTIGIKPRDELAKDAGIITSHSGGIVIDNHMRTSDPNIFAIGECASWNNRTFGLIAPGMMMADILCFNLIQAKYHSLREFSEPDIGTRLKLMGVNVASFGDYFADVKGVNWLPKSYKEKTVKAIVFEDPIEGSYTKLLFTNDGKYLLGGILVGNIKQFTKYAATVKARKPLDVTPSEFLFGLVGEDGDNVDMLTDDTQVCSCHSISKGQLVEKVRDGTCATVPELKTCTKAGTACGGCEPTVKAIFEMEMKKMGKSISKALCVHFNESRQDLFSVIMVKKYQSFKEVMKNLGTNPTAAGCEICKPTIASILSTLYNRHLLEADVHGLQDTNDRYLGNIQRNGTYSVVPRMSAGEVTPEKLIAIGEIAQKYDLYTKITGAQRVDLFGAAKEQLPHIWEELGKNGFESGQAYGKALRNVKSCVGSTWCRYGIGDSVGLAIRLEERYKGIRSPHKMKGGVSGCVRDCAEFHSKDFGLCAVLKGYNVYVGGNGGMKPAHAQLLKADVPPDQVIPLLDRYLMLYFRTADRLQRTARWLENLDGGIEYLRDVIVYDKLGIAQELEDQMNELVSHYYDEWASAVGNEKDSPIFQQFINTTKKQDTVEIIRERGQRRPADWPEIEVEKADFKNQQWSSLSWTSVCESKDLPDTESGSSATILVSDTQIAIFRLNGKLFASHNMCGHKRAFVLSQGIVSTDSDNNTYVSCPLHKRNYIIDAESEKKGTCKNDESQSLAVFGIKELEGKIYVKLPPSDELDKALGTRKWMVRKEESSPESVKSLRKFDEKFKIKVPYRKIVSPIGCSSHAGLDW